VYRNFKRSFMLLLRLRRGECAVVLHRILSWDLDRAIVGHGDIIESGAKPVIEHAWQFAHTAQLQVNITD
jgi:hypothetical protein